MRTFDPEQELERVARELLVAEYQAAEQPCMANHFERQIMTRAMVKAMKMTAWGRRLKRPK
jgi:hypothetical protein